MSRELFWLTLTAITTGLMWTPYIVDRVVVRGLMGAMDNPSPNAKPHSPWARRQMNAHDNAVENLVIFAILVLVANALHIFNNVTAAACATYFWARLAHYVIYTMGVPVLRTLTFVAGFAAEIVLVLAIFPLDLRQQANRLSSNRRVRVRHEDVPLVRDVVRAVADPQRESEARC